MEIPRESGNFDNIPSAGDRLIIHVNTIFDLRNIPLDARSDADYDKFGELNRELELTGEDMERAGRVFDEHNMSSPNTITLYQDSEQYPYINSDGSVRSPVSAAVIVLNYGPYTAVYVARKTEGEPAGSITKAVDENASLTERNDTLGMIKEAEWKQHLIDNPQADDKEEVAIFAMLRALAEYTE